jgi:hypothetical protein
VTQLDDNHYSGIGEFFLIVTNPANTDFQKFQKYLTFNGQPTHFYNPCVMYTSNVDPSKYALNTTLIKAQNLDLVKIMDYTLNEEANPSTSNESKITLKDTNSNIWFCEGGI